MTTIRVLIIPADPDDPMAWRHVDRGLDAFQGLVGGDVQVIDLGNNLTLWCLEDVTGLNVQLNRRATRLYHHAGGFPWADLCGDSFVTGGADDDGETLSFPAEQLDELHLAESVLS